LLFSGGAAAALVLASTLPAAAATTPTTFTIGAGALTISAPASANLGTVASGVGTLSGSLGGNVVVTDNRGLILGGWTASATSTDFSDGASPAHTIPATNVLYTPGAVTVTGVVVAVPLIGTLSNTTALNVVTATGVLGSDSASWDPTLTVTIPAAAPAGTYSATLTHSVA
jgi:hypothetical protein